MILSFYLPLILIQIKIVLIIAEFCYMLTINYASINIQNNQYGGYDVKRISVILIGAGGRGISYITKMSKMQEKFEVIAVADPLENRRRIAQDIWNIPDHMLFNSWTDILAMPKFADMAIIGTMDDMHYEPAMKAIELGYHLLLENLLFFPVYRLAYKMNYNY